MLHVALDSGVIEVAADKTLGIEDGVGWVHGDLGKGSVTNETLGVSERDIAGGCTIALIVGNNLNLQTIRPQSKIKTKPFRAGKHQRTSTLFQDQFR